VWAPGYAITRKRFEVPDAKKPVEVAVELERGVTFTGRTFDANDKASRGIPFTKIRFASRGFWDFDEAWPLTLAGTLRGASSGVVRFPNQRKEKQTIFADAPGYAKETLEADVTGESIATLLLHKSATIHGRATRGDGSGIPGLWVRLGPQAGSPPPSTSRRTVVTGPDGNYRLVDVHPGRYVLEFMIDWVPPEWSDTKDPNSSRDRQVEVAAGQSLEVNTSVESRPSWR
jgi:hypothetical protein